MKKLAVMMSCLMFLALTGHTWAQRGRDPKTATVSIKNSQYNPAKLSIQKGQTVVWTNNDDRDHTVEGEDFESGTIKPGRSYRYTFKQAGDYPYRCRLHPRMKGTVVVK